MRKVMRSYLVFVALALLSLLLGLSSFLLWVVFPRGYSVGRTLWVQLHKWGGLALTVAVAVHVALHRIWLGRMTRRVLSHVLGRPTQFPAALAEIAEE